MWGACSPSQVGFGARAEVGFDITRYTDMAPDPGNGGVLVSPLVKAPLQLSLNL